MKPRRYHGITVHPRINISSTGHYTADVHLIDRYTHKGYWYTLNVGLQSKRYNGVGIKDVPRYVTQEINATIRLMYLNGKVRFYEYDQDKNERTTDLRYHRLEWFKRLIGLDDAPEDEAAP